LNIFVVIVLLLLHVLSATAQSLFNKRGEKSNSKLIGTIAISVVAAYAAYVNRHAEGNTNTNSADIEKTETIFEFKQKLKNKSSGSTVCNNTALETLY
jgi:hypothetical protein